ncbi:PBP1 [Candida theae]|uniref:PBP1 n=1 Tax=Candida theae TaxID=1198502 RepID=A0AAD5G146_9ASCO|nr:PBP1 [Candida theae]KAI5968416.1 PBP1 [Candida theae]
MKPQSNRTGNKIVHRRAGSRHNGNSTGFGGRVSPTRGSSSGQDNANGQANFGEDQGDNRLIYLLAKSHGKPCTVTTTDGSRYRGLLLATDMWARNSNSAVSVVIKSPQLVGKSLIDEKNNLDRLPEQLVIQSKDLMDLEVEVNVNEPIKHYTREEFKTDADISNNHGKIKPFEERELVKWEPEEEEGVQRLTLEDEAAATTTSSTTTRNGNLHWDQFKVNEEKFGVESTYDEHLYTTRIDKSAPDYEQRLARANQIAAEIEGQATTDRHILEERGIQVDDSGLDEEDKYSGVDRRGDELMAALKMNSKSAKNDQVASSTGQDASKYVTPRQRAANYHNDPAIVSSSAANKRSEKKAPDSVPAKPQIPNEAFRLNAESEILSLRQFSANFKIPHKIPQDLLPILTKDKLKQDEILKKQQQEQEEKQKQVEKQEQLQNQPQKQEQKQEQGENAKPQIPSNASTPGTAAPPSQRPPVPSDAPSTSSAPQSSSAKPGAEKRSSKSFKLNPNAASFTPSLPHTTLTSPPKTAFNKQGPTSSPYTANTRTYSSNSSTQGTTKRHFQISAQDFFGDVSKVPTQEKQAQKLKELKNGFNMFNTTKAKAGDANTIYYEKPFQTPPTWDATIEETHEALFPRPMFKSPSYMPNPMIAATAPMPYNFQMPPQPQFPQQVAPAWFMPPPQNFGMMPNPYQNGQPGRRFK